MNVKRVKFVVLAMVLFWGTPLFAFDGYGVCATPSTKIQEETVPQTFELLEKAGVKWARLGFRWDEMEPRKGVYDFSKNDRLVEIAQRHNIKVLGLITRTPVWASGAEDTISPPRNIEDWKMFVRMLVTRYKGKITHWEVWNEPDIKKFWKGTPDEYVALLKEAYGIIKGIDPEIKVLSAGLDGNAEKGAVYLDKLLGLGMADYADIIAFHPYGKTPDKSLERVRNFLSVMQKHGVEKPLWLTEIGWQTGGWQGGPAIVKDEETKAFYLKEAFRLLKPHADAIFWYRAVEGPKMYGLLEASKDGSIATTPAYDAYKEMTAGRKK